MHYEMSNIDLLDIDPISEDCRVYNVRSDLQNTVSSEEGGHYDCDRDDIVRERRTQYN